MYLPKHFEETRPQAIRDLIRSHPLGTLVTQVDGVLDANLLPFLLDEELGEAETGVTATLPKRLLAHVARGNPLWKQVEEGASVLVVFRASDAYVSPNWYPSKHETHKQVPTWNYQAVNVHGRIRFVHDAQDLRQIVGRLSRVHEAQAEGARAWRMEDAPPDYLEAMLRAIVGVEIEVSRIEAKSKLSQNREVRDRLNAADELEARGQHAIAAAMRAAG